MTRVLERIADTRHALDKEREAGRSIGFVPTMGALHDGHRSLLRRARAENDVVAASIFVNPLQFGPAEDLEAYPRPFDEDLAALEAEGVDVLFHPPVGEMYPDGEQPVRVTVGPLGEVLCGASRPGHFDGVATVVTKLLSIVGPCRAYFGRKDFQQLVVLEHVVRALDLPVRVVGCETVREHDGLAMSSRNRYLSAEERRAAPAIARALRACVERVEAGERDARALVRDLASAVSSEPLLRLDYAACVDAGTLAALFRIEGTALFAVAAWAGQARLIDNMTVTAPAASIEGSR